MGKKDKQQTDENVKSPNNPFSSITGTVITIGTIIGFGFLIGQYKSDLDCKNDTTALRLEYETKISQQIKECRDKEMNNLYFEVREVKEFIKNISDAK